MFIMFKEIFTEMAMITGYRPNDFADGELDWDWYRKNKRFLKKVQGNITSRNYDVYKVGRGYVTYFLVKDDKYYGKISGDGKNNTFQISISESKLTKKEQFYLVMFTVILSEYKNITSDLMLSKGAFKSYQKLQ